MHWIAANENGAFKLDSLQLDIVGFLAILGEGSVLANAQVSTLSKWIFLPRLIPAPQALMRPSRPLVLEPEPGTVSGIWSGNTRDNINHIGNIVCDANNLATYSVRVVHIERVNNEQEVKSKTVAPLTLVIFIGFALSVFLLAFSVYWHDGMSLVATCLLSLLSTLIGLGNKWKLQLPRRRITAGQVVPRGDVVIRYPKGSFLVVRCDEDVARELYFAPAEIDYLIQHAPAYRILSLVGTTMLMGGVICLANAQIETQIAWAGSYMVLGAAYWIVAALPAKLHWDTSCYRVTNECLSDSNMAAKGFPSENSTFTQALWKAIVVTKNTDWVTRSHACPDTRAWQDWLYAARAVSKDVKLAEKDLANGVKTWEVPADWNPQTHLADLLSGQANADQQSLTHRVEEV
ncbi:hypothetical protein ACEQ8H_002156 [Pleosporales sp. CAS-2024a]